MNNQSCCRDNAKHRNLKRENIQAYIHTYICIFLFTYIYLNIPKQLQLTKIRKEITFN